MAARGRAGQHVIWRGVAGLWGLWAVVVIVLLAVGRILPLGDVIAFERIREQQVEIHLLHRTTGIHLSLTDQSQTYREPGWNPNGQILIYRDTSGNIYQAVQRERDTITDQFSPDGAVSELSWSPDGCCVAFTTWNNRDNGHEIHVRHLENGRVWPVVDSVVLSQTNPRWSPDGHMLAFSGYLINSGRPPRIYVVPLSTEAATRTTPARQVPLVVTDGFEGYAYPVWSPDGTHIYFIRALDTQLLRVPIDGTIKLPEDFERVGNIQTNGPISFSPDGTTMAFSAKDRWGRDALFVANPDGSHPRQITFPPRNPTVRDLRPVWRP